MIAMDVKRGEQRIHQQCRRAEHGDFAQRVEPAKVDQDHIDDVGSAAVGQRLLQIERRDRREGSREHRVRDAGDANARDAGQARVAPLPAPAGFRGRLLRKEMQHDHHQRNGRDLDQQLRQRQVRRRERHEQEADREPGRAQQHQRGQSATVVEGRCERRHDPQQPQQPSDHRIRSAAGGRQRRRLLRTRSARAATPWRRPTPPRSRRGGRAGLSTAATRPRVRASVSSAADCRIENMLAGHRQARHRMQVDVPLQPEVHDRRPRTAQWRSSAAAH